MAIINGRGRVGIRRPSAVATPSIVLDGLKLYLDAGKTTSYSGTGTVWTDLSTSGSNATLVNGPTYSSANSGVINFDGSNDFVTVAGLLPYSSAQEHTYSALVYPTAFATNYTWIINNGNTTNGTSLIFQSNRVGFFYQGGAAYASGTGAISLNAWTHVTAAYNGAGTVRFYINGALDRTVTGLPAWTGTSSNTSFQGNGRIGSWVSGQYNGAYLFSGKISNAQVYGRALTAAEVAQNFDALKPRFYPQVSDANAQAFIYAANIVSSAQANAVNTLVTSLKAAGVWAKMKAVYPFVGGSAASHKWNLKDPRDLDAAYRLTFTVGWVHSSTGAKPNGTSDYANTFLNAASKLSAGNANMTYYSRTSAMIGNKTISAMGCATWTGNEFTSDYLVLQIDNYYYSIAYMTNSAFAYRSQLYPSNNASGLWSANRTSGAASALRLWRNGVAVGTTPTLSICNFPNLNVYLGSQNAQGTAATFDNKECAFASLGDGLTDAESASLYTAVQAFQTSLGRQV